MMHWFFKRFQINGRHCVFMVFLLISLVSKSQFLENKGQFSPEILFSKPIFSGNVLISEAGISYLFYDNSQFQELYEKFHHKEPVNQVQIKNGNASKLTIKYHSIEQQFVGGRILSKSINASDQQSNLTNFFLGSNSDNWASNVRSFNKILIREIYAGIDVELLSNGLELKYNFICRPGSNPAQIKVKYKGASSLELTDKGLKIKTTVLDYTEIIPVSYVISSLSGYSEVPVKAKLDGDILTFINTPAGFQSSNSTLVIDPKLIFSTYSGTTSDNFGFTATYDSQGNMYAGGITTGPYLQIPDGKYPATPGAFDQTYNGGSDLSNDYGFPCDITISKYSADGKNLVYATYIGGSDNEYPHSIVVDKFGNLAILGSSFSFDYPVTPNAYKKNHQLGSDIIVTKLGANGDVLVGSTFYGGSSDDGLNKAFATKYFYADDFRGDIICDDDGSMLAVMSTSSDDIEIKNGFKNSKSVLSQQGIIFKFSTDASDLVWSSYVGGYEDAALYSIDLDKNKDIFISGGISSEGLPNTMGTVNPIYKGGRSDGFIAKISADGSTLLKATYFGSDKYDQILSLELDNADRVYVIGQTEGVIPIKGTVYNNASSGQFVSMLDHDLTSILLSTTFGTGDGLPDITINAFMVDECRRIFVSGWGGKSSSKYFSSTKNLPITNDALQKTTDGSDFYIIVFGKDFRKLVYATYFGGNLTGDHVDGGTSRWDKKGVIYQSVCSSCPLANQVGPISDFPTTKGTFAEKNISPRCSNAAFKFALENLNLQPQLRDTFFEVMAFDTLNFDFTISDPDDDTINTQFSSKQGIEHDFIQFPKLNQSVASYTARFSWRPGCNHAYLASTGKDTFSINATVNDRGCPDFQSNSAVIRIKVLPPPVIDPPQTLCLLFKQNDHLLISWEAIPSSKYFKYLVLYKRFPDGTLLAMDTFKTVNAGSLLDKNVLNPRNQNYSYFIKAFNLCDKAGPSSYILSSVQESESPIPATQLVTATVIGNKDVSVHWLPSKEADFGSYSIYRSSNDTNLKYDYLLSLDNRYDTFFVDRTVNVQNQSFCYSVVVNDKCGHSSKKSNIGCNIILSGVSKPFYHVLDWPAYRKWDAGVLNYTLERAVDTGVQRPIVSVFSNLRSYNDRELDYDWGGYWYSVVAQENYKGLGATSRSNSIYLIQPPLLHVPNAFTRNDDQLNETWGFVPVFVKTYHMQVFNRWGEKVFDSYNKKEDWAGNYYGETKGPEVFVWQVTYTGWDRSNHYQKGTVTVVK
jgi:gliding motility-associated-like protein